MKILKIWDSIYMRPDISYSCFGVSTDLFKRFNNNRTFGRIISGISLINWSFRAGPYSNRIIGLIRGDPNRLLEFMFEINTLQLNMVEWLLYSIGYHWPTLFVQSDLVGDLSSLASVPNYRSSKKHKSCVNQFLRANQV